MTAVGAISAILLTKKEEDEDVGASNIEYYIGFFCCKVFLCTQGTDCTKHRKTVIQTLHWSVSQSTCRLKKRSLGYFIIRVLNHVLFARCTSTEIAVSRDMRLMLMHM